MINEKKLDAIDVQILSMLLKESRTPFIDLAKACQISLCAARMRYNKLKEASIITGANVHVNPKFWGYEYIVDIRVEASLNHEEEVLEMLRKKRYVLAAANFSKNIMGYAVLPKVDNLRSIIEEIEGNPHVKHIDTLVWIQGQKIFYPENLIIKPFTTCVAENKLEENCVPVNDLFIDDIDKQIVRILARDARTPFNKIANQLDISIHNVIQRYRKLREEKVITLSSISVNLNKLGYNGNCVTFIKLESKTKISEVRAQLLKLPNAILLIEHLGAYDLRVDIPVGNIQDILDVTKRIRLIQGIEKMDVSINEGPPNWPIPFYNKLLG